MGTVCVITPFVGRAMTGVVPPVEVNGALADTPVTGDPTMVFAASCTHVADGAVPATVQIHNDPD
jgi:hypothetical protein